MLEGKISGAYSVMPEEPVSNASGMLTGFDPTAVTMTNNRLPSAADVTGYKFIVVGLRMLPEGGGTGIDEFEFGEFEPPHPASCTVSRPASVARTRR